ncbi:MAG: GNAT family N-acetyltransferase [Lacisediminihabitans sp.]
MSFVVVYDADVLYPSTLRDVLIRVALSGMVQARWSDQILEEVFRNLVKDCPDLDPAHLERTRGLHASGRAAYRLRGLSGFFRPRPISSEDDCSSFDCGEESLSEWIRQRALRNERGRASRTFVSLGKETDVVAGYYCLSASSLRSGDAVGALKRNMPDPIPIILIGRLAVDSRFTGVGLGVSLLQDAAVKSVEASRLIGARAVLVHALTDDAQSFYQKFGFAPVPKAARAMYLLMADAEATLAAVAS